MYKQHPSRPVLYVYVDFAWFAYTGLELITPHKFKHAKLTHWTQKLE